MVAFTFLFSLVLIGALLFVFVVYPVWMIVDCATSASRKTFSKALWIVFMLLAWTLGCVVYGLLASRKKALQWTSGILLGVGILTAYFLVRGLFYAADLSSREALTKINAIQAGALTQNDLDQLKEDLVVLARERNAEKGILKIFAADQTLKNITLTQILLKMQSDGTLTPKEYQIWVEKFSTRQTQDTDALKKFLDTQGWQ